MRICIVNQANIPDKDVQHAIRAINAQLISLAYDWSIAAQCRLEGTRSLRHQTLHELRGDAIIYLVSDVSRDWAGFHDARSGIPYGIVTAHVDEPWTVTLSHEVLELVADPHCNRLVAGPHPDVEEDGRIVFHWMELCDAVQACTYEIAGIEVADYVLPAYFTPGEEPNMRMTYLGNDLKSFSVYEGGYIGFFDPEMNLHNTYFMDDVGSKAFHAKTSHAGRTSVPSRVKRYIGIQV